MKKNIAFVVLLALTIVGIANASAIKTFTTETLTPTSLNTVLQHIHNSLRGSGHTLITNADVSASAAIADTKLSGLFIPKKLAVSSAVCSASPCTLSVNSGFTSITRNSTGIYTANFPARANTAYGAHVTSLNTPIAGTFCFGSGAQTTTAFEFQCMTHAGAVNDTAFIVTFFDDAN